MKSLKRVAVTSVVAVSSMLTLTLSVPCSAAVQLPLAGVNRVLADSLVPDMSYTNLTAGITKELADILGHAQEETKRQLEEEQRKAEEEQRKAEEEAVKQQALEAAMMSIFGHVLTDEEVDHIKRVCMAEGGGTESIKGLEKIFEVIANRCKSDRFPNTVEEVLFQKYQFETVTKGLIWKYEVNDRVEEAWSNLIERGYCEDSEILFFTAGGYNKYCEPMYQFGNHYFGK